MFGAATTCPGPLTKVVCQGPNLLPKPTAKVPTQVICQLGSACLAVGWIFLQAFHANCLQAPAYPGINLPWSHRDHLYYFQKRFQRGVGGDRGTACEHRV